jgi:hypothetical protein
MSQRFLRGTNLITLILFSLAALLPSLRLVFWFGAWYFPLFFGCQELWHA